MSEPSCCILPDEAVTLDSQTLPLLEAEALQAFDRPHQFKAKHAVATAMLHESYLVEHHAATRDADMTNRARLMARPAP